MRLLPIVAGCRAVVLYCLPEELVGSEVICQYKCKPETYINLPILGPTVLQGDVWYVTLVGNSGYGYICEPLLMRIDGYDRYYTESRGDDNEQAGTPDNHRSQELRWDNHRHRTRKDPRKRRRGEIYQMHELWDCHYVPEVHSS